MYNRKKNVLWNLSKFDIGLEETGRERRGEDQNREKIEKMLSNRKINEAPTQHKMAMFAHCSMINMTFKTI